MTADREIYERLRLFMNERQIKQSDIADDLGLAARKITDTFRGRSAKWLAPIIAHLVEKFHLNENWVLTGEGEQETRARTANEGARGRYEMAPLVPTLMRAVMIAVDRAHREAGGAATDEQLADARLRTYSFFASKGDSEYLRTLPERNPDAITDAARLVLRLVKDEAAAPAVAAQPAPADELAPIRRRGVTVRHFAPGELRPPKPPKRKKHE